jgi:hypothetical protein
VHVDEGPQVAAVVDKASRREQCLEFLVGHTENGIGFMVPVAEAGLHDGGAKEQTRLVRS